MNVRVNLYDRSRGVRLVSEVVEASPTVTGLLLVLSKVSAKTFQSMGSISGEAMCVGPNSGMEIGTIAECEIDGSRRCMLDEVAECDGEAPRS